MKFFSFVVLALVTLTACGDTSDGGLDDAREEFVSSCKAAYDASCTRGFECDSFFATSQFNSVRHCKDELYLQTEHAADSLNTREVASRCARMCDTMRADVEALSCEQFDQATFNRYRCDP